MHYQDILLNFRNYTPEQVERLREAWNLSMSADLLTFCVNHYRTQELRDPYVDELCMLDQLSGILEEGIGSLCLSDFHTNDEFVAETYADLTTKRRSVNPHATYPLTLTEAVKTANAYLSAVGTPYYLNGFSPLPEYIDEIESYSSEACVKTPESAFRLRVLPTLEGSLLTGDLLLLVEPAQGQTRLQFGRLIEELLANDKIIDALHGIYKVNDGGILSALLENVSAARINLAAFSAWEEPMPMTVMTNQHGGARILRIHANNYSEVVTLLREYGASPVLFGQITNDDRYTFMRGTQNVSVEIKPQFLRILFHYKPLRIRLRNEYELAPCEVNTQLMRDIRCRYINDTSGNASPANVRGILTAVASSSPTSAFFKSALYTTLIPVVTLAAAGVDYAKQALSIGLTFPADYTDPTVAGEAMSTVLGIYRVQTELGIAAQGLSVQTDKEVLHPSVTAFALSDAVDFSSSFTEAGNFVYCITPNFRESGLPDFRSLRTLLDRLSTLVTSDVIVSAKAFATQSITDAIRSMNGKVCCRLTDLSVACEDALPLGILVESKQRLGWREIGVTQLSKTDAAEELHLPRYDAFLSGPRTRTVIVANPDDADANALASLLTCRGCSVKSFARADVSDEGFTESLMNAHAFILCKKDIPTSDELASIFSTMADNGCVLIALGMEHAPTDAFFCHPKGISPKILDEISQKENIFKKT